MIKNNKNAVLIEEISKIKIKKKVMVKVTTDLPIYLHHRILPVAKFDSS
jgi:hypothetical protein